MTSSTNAQGRPDTARSAWALALLALLLVGGIAICLYLTRFHENAMYGDSSAELANCPETETTNCEAVNTSGYSELAGIPISAIGIPTYALLLWMVAMARRRRHLLPYIFTIGLLTVGYSGYLYYVSTVKIGFLCLWCFRLYLVNAGIPVLAWLSAWRNPLRLLGDAVGDLLRFTPDVRLAAGLFASLLVLTIVSDRVYRGSLTRSQVSAVPAPETHVQPESATPDIPVVVPTPPPALPPPIARSQRETAPSPRPRPTTPEAEASPAAAPGVAEGNGPSGTAALRSIEGHAGGVEIKPFDLGGHLGKGRPVALLFWAPGFPNSESALVELTRFLKEKTPQFEVYAVAGRRDDQRPEMLWERFCMLPRPKGLPLLVDDGFALSKQLDVTDVPDLVLFDAKGALIIAKIKSLEQILSLSPERLGTTQVIERVAAGHPPAPIRNVPPYFPATELYGRCAPEFTLPDVTSQKDVKFTGRSANGRPTLLVFWSSTCKHCQKEIPQLLAYVRDHPDRLDVVSVSFIKPDRKDGFSHRRITEAYIARNGITWPVLDDSSAFADDLYRVVSTPTTFLLSPGGQIRDAWYYPHANLAAVLDAELPRLAASRDACRPQGNDDRALATFSVLSPDGKSRPLSSLTDRPSLVHLWATWCTPCRTELPGLLKFRPSLESSGGRLVLVSVEDATAADRISAYGSKLDPAFLSYRAPNGGLADLLDLGYSVPRTMVVAADGRVLKTLYGSQPWEDPAFQRTVRALLQLPGRTGTTTASSPVLR